MCGIVGVRRFDGAPVDPDLLRAMNQRLDQLVDRRKVVFRVPLDSWFRGELHEFAWDMLTSRHSLATSPLNRPAVERLLARHRSGKGNEKDADLDAAVPRGLARRLPARGGRAESDRGDRGRPPSGPRAVMTP
jgi:hypothetical protein